MATTVKLERRFWAKVSKTDGCWLWTAAQSTGGYGKFGEYSGSSVKTWNAHRLAWVLTSGPIAPGLEVCHRCNVKLCVRPDHLYLAEHRQNSADAARDGLYAVGERHPDAKLTNSDVAELRRLYAAGHTTVELGRRFGIHSVQVSVVARGNGWKRAPSRPVDLAIDVAAFISECCVSGPGWSALVDSLHQAYSTWSIERGQVPLRKSPFGRALSSLGMTKRRFHGGGRGARGWRGLSLAGKRAA